MSSGNEAVTGVYNVNFCVCVWREDISYAVLLNKMKPLLNIPQNCSLVDYDAMSQGKYFPTFRRIVVPFFSRVCL